MCLLQSKHVFVTTCCYSMRKQRNASWKIRSSYICQFNTYGRESLYRNLGSIVQIPKNNSTHSMSPSIKFIIV